MHTEMIREITNMLKAERFGLSVNNIFKRLKRKHKQGIRDALKALIASGDVKRHIVTGEVASYLHVPYGTEFYILNNG